MRKHSFTGLIATGLIAIITLNFTYSVEECPAADITVQLDQPVYVVNGPGDSIIAQILIDGDSNKEGLQPVDHGLFSAGLKITFDERKAAVNSPSDVTVQRELNYFGFGAPALVATTPSGEVSFHGNISQADLPPTPYHGTILGSVALNNLASPTDRYPLTLDFNRDLGSNQDFFVDGTGVTRDAMITFIPSEVVVEGSPVPCDVDGNGRLDAQDIDSMARSIQAGHHPSEYDLNTDSQVNFADFQLLIESPNCLNTWIGDSDLNGQFDEQDIVVAFIAGKYLTDKEASWADGDWNGNLTFTEQDFVSAFIAGGYLQGPRSAVAAVPEPTSGLLMLLGLWTLTRLRQS
ncbi:MAG: hypothetical protein CMJ80_14955 [Planctomycetaceae bacterium]|nr:hypothetical protein [Planctomycetaceae bacterium]